MAIFVFVKFTVQDGVKSARVHGVFINHPALIDQTTVIDNRAGNDSGRLGGQAEKASRFIYVTP